MSVKLRKLRTSPLFPYINKIAPKKRLSEFDSRYKTVQEFQETVKDIAADLQNEVIRKNFTISFSKEIDLLSQWRGYCSPNAGYGIVFETEDIERSSIEKFESCSLKQCIYKTENKEKELRILFNKHFPNYSNTEAGSFERESAATDLYSEMNTLACFFKDSGFIEEKESRLVVQLSEDEIWKMDSNIIKFRVGRNCILPYIEVPFDKSAIKQIVIGPTNDMELAKNSLQEFIYQNAGEHEIEIIESRIPYRVW